MPGLNINSDTGKIQKGYLAIADISGYTKFLLQTELDHAHEILAELTNLLINKLSAPFQFVELEGDAVFVFAPEPAVEDSERLMDIIEVCYAAFRLKQEQMTINTLCNCKACRSIKNLNLKFVAHFGSYVLQKTGSQIKPIGKDVILVHRLLKNTVVQLTGMTAYALFTDAFIIKATFRESGLGLKKHREEYPELGVIECHLLDLEQSIKNLQESNSYYIQQGDADLEIVTELPAPRSAVWSYHLDIKRRLKWQLDTKKIENRPSPGGRTEVGWESHCDHGNYRLIHRIIDWKPFEYMSMETISEGKSLAKPPTCRATFDFKDLPDNHCEVAMRLSTINRGIASRGAIALLGWLVKKQWRNHYQVLVHLLQEENIIWEK